MQEVNVGRSGLRVSALGLGCNAFGMRIDAPASTRIVDAALASGITLFDTADSYAAGLSEEYLGQALGARRGDAVIATKFGMPMGPGRQGASRRYIYRALEASLRRLGTDWIDLYQLHFPDPLTPISETLSTLEDLRRQGKIRYYGCSNLSPAQLAEAGQVARATGAEGFISTQAEYSLLKRGIEDALVPTIGREGMSLFPYFPLSSGLLTGKYGRDRRPEGARLSAPNTPWLEKQAQSLLSDEVLDRVESLGTLAEGMGRDLLSVALNWLAAQPVVASVIAGASSPAQLEANVAAMARPLSAAEVAALS